MYRPPFLLLFYLTMNGETGLRFDEPAKLSTPYVINKDGYQLENHTVVTSDGYILTVFRIPSTTASNKNSQTQSQKQVVLLMHGFLSSSLDWFLNGPQKALGYVLSDAGYDVWAANSRGTRYSESHIKKDQNSSDFWNFSWHEMGIYDLPSIVKYILNSTGAKDLHYIGHSQGATQFFIACSTFMTINRFFRSAQLLGPASYLSHSSLLKSQIQSLPILQQIADSFGYSKIAPSSRLREIGNEMFCKDGTLTQSGCKEFVFSLVGESLYLNTTMLPEILTTHSVGSSLKQLLHFLQLSKSGRFQQYDYGQARNRELYNCTNPPKYAIENIKVDTYLYYCDNDAIVDPKDVQEFSIVYPKRSLKRSLLLPFTGCNHIDFINGIQVNTYVNQQILKTLRSYD